MGPGREVWALVDGLGPFMEHWFIVWTFSTWNGDLDYCGGLDPDNGLAIWFEVCACYLVLGGLVPGTEVWAPEGNLGSLIFLMG